MLRLPSSTISLFSCAEGKVLYYLAAMDTGGELGKELSVRIIACRKRLGLSQVALAKACAVYPTTVSKWELGATKPFRKLSRLASALGVSTDYLLAGVTSDSTTASGRAHGLPPSPREYRGSLPQLHSAITERAIDFAGMLPRLKPAPGLKYPEQVSGWLHAHRDRLNALRDEVDGMMNEALATARAGGRMSENARCVLRRVVEQAETKATFLSNLTRSIDCADGSVKEFIWWHIEALNNLASLAKEIASHAAFGDETADFLPTKLSEEEKERRWKEYLAECESVTRKTKRNE